MASDQKDPFDWVGSTIDGQFTVEDVVGEGGFAVVYRGHHKGFDEKVAIKALKFPAKLGEEERAKFLESFKAEGKLLRKLSSADAAVVQALDVGAATSPNGTWTPYLILEWLDGETLDAEIKARIKSGAAPRSLGEAISLLDPAAHGLATAHGLGIAHRDVKPQNLFLKSSPAVGGDRRSLKIVDFGIAKVMTDSEDVMRTYEATGESIHAFSPKYGAPEQFDRKFGATGPWTDVFALALVLVEVVAGRSAMKGDTSELFILASNKAERPTLKALGVEENDAVEQVLSKALAVDPKDRYADAGAFWSALREAAAHGATVLSKRDDQLAKPVETDLAATRVEGQPITKAAEPPLTTGARATQLVSAALIFAVGGTLMWWAIPHHGFWADVVNPPPPVEDPGPVRQGTLAVVESASAAAVVPQNATIASVSGYTRYANAKYAYVIDIPNDFTQFEDTLEQDGRIYTNADRSARLEVFGGELVGSLSDMYKAAYVNEGRDLERWVIPVHTLTPDLYVITGYEKEASFVEKVVVSGGIYGKLHVTFPSDEASKVHFEAILPHARDSFSFTAVSNTVAKPLPVEDDESVRIVDVDAGPSPKKHDAGNLR